MKPGVYFDMSEETYSAIPALRSTFLRAMLKTTPAQALAEDKTVESDALRFGRLLHCCVLEPERFERDLAVQPKFEGKGAHAMRAEWLLRNAGKIQTKPKELEQLLAMREAVLKQTGAALRFSVAGRNEVSIVWQDPLGFLCKTRIDRLHAGKDVLCIAELKSTRNADERLWRFDADRYGYDVEACMQLRALSITYGEMRRPYSFVCVEKTEPYRVEVYELRNSDRQLGTEKMMRGMEVYAQCLRTGEWPNEPIYSADERAEGAA